MSWLVFAMMTVVSWGLYGAFLHTGQMGMADPVSGRYKAFLFVGLAYFLTAVLAPLLVLKAQGATWAFPMKGVLWSLLAGALGSIGAFCVLLAFGAKGTPPVVMSIVFGGAPVVNALYSLTFQAPSGGWAPIRWPFYAGLLLVALGGCLVTLYKPAPAVGASPHAANLSAVAEPQGAPPALSGDPR
jgi:hypothetical protein